MIVQLARSAFPDYPLFVLDAGTNVVAAGKDGGAEAW
jgi:hypothetical protein